jgi:hypothetical protein
MLFSYCLRYDDGAAPNPYGGLCTLTICKPVIRRTAREDDWIVGLGSMNTRLGDISDRVIYAMRVTRTWTLSEYDAYCQRHLKIKIPDWSSTDFVKRVGDCIYDYSGGGKPRQRESVHVDGNVSSDLAGENALGSSHFYYFGDQPLELRRDLISICHRTQGHKSKANAGVADKFIAWIESLGYQPGKLYGEPLLKDWFENALPECSPCAQGDREDSEADEKESVC